MCIAVPMKLTEIKKENKMGKAVFSGNEIDVNISLISPQIGDYVLVHAGCAIEIVEQETADEILAIFNTLEELNSDEPGTSMR